MTWPRRTKQLLSTARRSTTAAAGGLGHARFEIHTNFTTPEPDLRLHPADLAARPAEPLRVLRALFRDPTACVPTGACLVTEQAAAKFAGLRRAFGARPRSRGAGRGPLPRSGAVLPVRQDAGLLPRGLMKRLVENLYTNPAASTRTGAVVSVMAREAGRSGRLDRLVRWRVVRDAPAIDLRRDEIRVIRDAASDWADVNRPSSAPCSSVGSTRTNAHTRRAL